MKPTYTIDDVVRYCMEYKKRTGRYLSYGHAVAMIEREERAAREQKKKAATKRRRKKGGDADGQDANGRGRDPAKL